MTKHFSLVVTLDGVLTGIAYWFNIHLSANNTLSTGPNSYSEVIQVPVCCYARFFLEKNFRGGKTKFSRNGGGQAKIHKIYVVHTLSTCTSFSMLESDRACP